MMTFIIDRAKTYANHVLKHTTVSSEAATGQGAYGTFLYPPAGFKERGKGSMVKTGMGGGKRKGWASTPREVQSNAPMVKRSVRPRAMALYLL